MDADLRERFRRLPAVDQVLSSLAAQGSPVPSRLAVPLIREALDAAREALRRGEEGPELTAEAVAARVRNRLDALATFRPEGVINATGVLIHTNLGRSPLSDDAARRIHEIARGYSDLEFDLETGSRGSRHDHVRDLLRLLTGAEDALVVNNNAAAVLLVLAALARGREVVISRGELVEIGGSFRIPEILEASGARLREVGTTNRTHLRDYQEAVGSQTGLLLRVHASNYRIEGFTTQVPLEDLTALGRERGVPVAVDLGSGALTDVSAAGIEPEPLVADVVGRGPDVVTFSGDKLLGGPQAGIVLGKRETIARIKRNPLARAVRIDKLLLAALQATLVAYLDEERAHREIPVLRMLFEAPEAIRDRAERLAQVLQGSLPAPAPQVMVEDSLGAVGGGTLPLEGLRTSVVALDPRPYTSAARFERAMRHVHPALLGRVHEERILLDLRTVTVDEEGQIPGLVAEAWTTAKSKGA